MTRVVVMTGARMNQAAIVQLSQSPQNHQQVRKRYPTAGASWVLQWNVFFRAYLHSVQAQPDRITLRHILKKILNALSRRSLLHNNNPRLCRQSTPAGRQTS